jgi:predicted transporter
MRKRRIYAWVLSVLALVATAIAGVAAGRSGEVLVGLLAGVVVSAIFIAAVLYFARKWERRKSKSN